MSEKVVSGCLKQDRVSEKVVSGCLKQDRVSEKEVFHTFN